MIAKQKIHQANNFMGAFDYNDQKMKHEDPMQRAVLLDHNFHTYDRKSISMEVSMLRQLRPNLTRDTYHVSLNFGDGDRLNHQKLKGIAHDYLEGMQFDSNLFAIWKHNDAEHLHIHILASRIRFDGTVVSDSNNYQRSEALCRDLERKYGLEAVQSSKETPIRAPSFGEIKFYQRTGQLSEKMLLQQRVKLALAESDSLESFINNCASHGVFLLFNQSKSTGRVSGITYISDKGFVIKGQKLGNLFKFNNIKNNINYYESNKCNARISQENSRTRERFGTVLAKYTRNKQGNVSSRPFSESVNSETANGFGNSQSNQTSRGEAGLYSNIRGADGDQEGVSKNENLDHNLFPNSSGAANSLYNSNLHPVSFEVEEEEEEERKRKRKWRRKR